MELSTHTALAFVFQGGHQEIPSFGGVAVPSVGLCRTRRTRSDAEAETGLFVKAPEQIGQSRAIARIAQNEAVRSLGDDLRAAVVSAGDHRQSASHGFEWRQREGILASRADVGVRGGVKINGIRKSGFPSTLATQS